MNTDDNTKTKIAKSIFIEALKEFGTVRYAADTAGISRGTAYRWRQMDADFDRAWKDAVEDAADVIERCMYERALEGNTTAAIFMLKGMRPDKFRDRTENINRNIEEERVAGRSREENMNAIRVNLLKLAGREAAG